MVSVVGSNFLYTHFLDWKLFLPASAIGLLSVAVLNLNNMRDIENDKIAKKRTLVVKMGLNNAKIYHFSLFIVSLLLMIVFAKIIKMTIIPILIVNILFLKHLDIVKKATAYKDFDPELKKVALGTFALSLLLAISLIYLS